VNDKDGRATLVLVACSDGSSITPRAGRERITTEEALEFIVSRQGQLWTFFGDYDVNFWLRDFSERTLNRLRKRNWSYWGDWRVHHIPRRVFEVWHRPTKRYACIYDAFPFVQSSFVRWLEDWKLCNGSTLREVARMKERRAAFSSLSPARILRYTRTEVDCIASGVEKLKDRVLAAGYAPSRWLGPGAIAAKALREHRVKDYMPRKTHPKALDAFYGGRIETSLVGMVRQPLHYYDIASAYPAAMVDLPCFRHGRWTRSTLSELDEGPSLVHVSWSPQKGKELLWGPLPCRPIPHASLRYYQRGQGWYWWDEVKPWTTSPSPYLWTVTGSWTWRQTCQHKPLVWIAELYDKRREMKRAEDPAEYALKLILNSCYGKFAQHVGRAPYRCVEWAGLITARTRARLGEILVQQPEDVLLVATDGYVTTRKQELGAALTLGAWENGGTFDWADIWQPGFYFLSDGLLRTRGFTRSDVDVQAFRDEWLERGVLGKVKVHRERVTGYRLATAQRRMENLCTWTSEDAEVSFWPWPRRDFGDQKLPTMRTAAPLSWQAEAKRGGIDNGAAFRKARQLWDYLEDGEPQGYVRD